MQLRSIHMIAFHQPGDHDDDEYCNDNDHEGLCNGVALASEY